MIKYRTIEIDLALHKLIETQRRSFEEKPYQVLKRLLEMGEEPEETPPAELNKPAPKLSKAEGATSELSWTGEGVTLPHGTLLEMTYSGRTYNGHIANGKWVIDSQTFESPSGTASGIAVTRKGRRTRLDGWAYWRVKRPEDTQWVELSGLRAESLLEKLGL